MKELQDHRCEAAGVAAPRSLRRSLQRAGFVLSLVTILACALSCVCSVRYTHVASSTSSVPGRLTTLELQGGCLRLLLDDWAAPFNPPGLHVERSLFIPLFFVVPLFSSSALSLPLWIPFLVLFVPSWLSRWYARRKPSYCCRACGYDLRGIRSDLCPECGTPRTPTRVEAAPRPSGQRSSARLGLFGRIKRHLTPPKIVLGLAVAGVLLAYPVYSILSLGFPGTECTNVWQYRQVRAQFSERLISHFPRGIPWAATNRRLSYTTCLGPATGFQVAYELPQNQIQRIAAEARAKAKAVYQGCGDDRLAQSEDYPIPAYAFGPSGFPSGSFIFVLDAAQSSPGTWNHGHSYGITVDEQSNEVVYWLDLW